MFANSEQITETENYIKYILNATTLGFTGAIDDARRNETAVTKSRIYATIEVFNAIAGNPQHGYWGEFAENVPVSHGGFLPAHVGAHGIPLITFSDSVVNEMTGTPADPDEIDSYRRKINVSGVERGLFSKTPHDELDANGLPSEVAGYYSIINNVIKFTGKYCYVPIIRVPPPYIPEEGELDDEGNPVVDETVETFWNEHLPVFAIPTVVKLAPFYQVKEGDNLSPIAANYYQMGLMDLKRIATGATTVSPVADVMEIQKEV